MVRWAHDEEYVSLKPSYTRSTARFHLTLEQTLTGCAQGLHNTQSPENPSLEWIGCFIFSKNAAVLGLTWSQKFFQNTNLQVRKIRSSDFYRCFICLDYLPYREGCGGDQEQVRRRLYSVDRFLQMRQCLPPNRIPAKRRENIIL
jgi:hypothetical protein